MTIQTVANVLIGLALVCWICYRQLTWRPVSFARMWKMPAVLGIVGVVMLSQLKSAHTLNGLDIAVLVIELVISLAIGALMGQIAVIRPLDREAALAYASRRSSRRASRYGSQADADLPAFETRTGWWGLALWIGMIALRIGIDVVATELGAAFASATGVILIMVAANRVARAFVIAARTEHRPAVTA
jgi:hypothetical protein